MSAKSLCILFPSVVSNLSESLEKSFKIWLNSLERDGVSFHHCMWLQLHFQNLFQNKFEITIKDDIPKPEQFVKLTKFVSIWNVSSLTHWFQKSITNHKKVMVPFIFIIILKLILYVFLCGTSNYLNVESGMWVTVCMTQLFFMDQGLHLVWKSASDFDLGRNIHSILF